MALTVYENLEQGSEEWLQARCGIVTASTVGQLITTKTIKPASNETARSLTAHLVAERITGYVEPTYVSADMERGNLSEPYARDAYAEQQGLTVDEIGFMVREQGDTFRLGWSPDGLVGEVGAIEIKSPRQKKHLQTILADEVPPEHMAQLQAGLLVSGRGWIDFISYCGGFPLYVKRVTPDQKWADTITLAVQTFEQRAEEMTNRYKGATVGKEPMERIDFDQEMEIQF
ncbi:lambda exonuclease family protein [Micrococcus sp. TA1]|uniref:lambda exonuclease family protein n=1 Tax=Micrococcus sp. TA1 TaxID=681627 RepID=UPI001608E7E5|nr:lambda exonuclease family protein [Micrococcus sp. TA1]MBB5748577.1 hypothetical protein [Micrococcus sp. TA1]